MSRRSNHVVPSSGGWSVKKSGAAKASRSFDTKNKAVRYGQTLSKTEKTELYIHKKNGMIEDKRSYYPDFHPPKG